MQNKLFTSSTSSTSSTATNNAPSYLLTFDIIENVTDDIFDDADDIFDDIFGDSNTITDDTVVNTVDDTITDDTVVDDTDDTKSIANSNVKHLTMFITTANTTKFLSLTLANNRKVAFAISDTEKVLKVLSTLLTPSKNGMSSSISKIETKSKARIIDVFTGEVISDNSTSKDDFSIISFSYSFNDKKSANEYNFYCNHGKNKVFNITDEFAVENNNQTQSLINSRICGVITNSILDNFIFKLSKIELYDNQNQSEFDIDEL